MPRLVGAIPTTCERIAESSRFQSFISAVIVANAATLGLATYDGIEAEGSSRHGPRVTTKARLKP